MARWDSASTTVPVKPPPSKVWKVASMVVRPAVETISRHLARKRSPSRRSCGSQRQPVRSPIRCRPFIFLLPKMRRRSLPRIWEPGHAFHLRPLAHSAYRSRSIRARPPRSLCKLAADLRGNRVDQAASDRDFARKLRQLQYVEPLCFLDFGFLRPQLAAHPLADEGDHERMRERPRLAGDVASVANPHADLFLHFARQALLERLARLGKTGQRAEHAGRKVRAAGEDKHPPATHEQHHRRRHARIGRELAGGADAHPPPPFCLSSPPPAPPATLPALP